MHLGADARMTVVLAFDTAIKCGAAVGRPGEKPHTFTVDLGKADWNTRFSRCLRMVDHCIAKFKPDLIVVEAPAQGGFANSDLVGLTVLVRGQAALRGVRCEAIMANSVRKHFLGRALRASDFPGKSHAAAKGAIKAQVIGRCLALGWDVRDADAADAAALWDFACSRISKAHQITSVGGLFGERT